MLTLGHETLFLSLSSLSHLLFIIVPRKLKFICSSIINAIQTILHGGWDARTEFGSYTGLLFFI